MERFRRVRSAGVVTALAAVVILALGFVVPARAQEAVLLDDPVASAHLVVLANAERAEAGLPPLEARYDVTELALEHSRRMAAAGDLFHNDDYFTPAVRQRLGARSLGENVALNRSVEDAHRRLMLSPGHRANLMNPKFTVVGMAVVRTIDGTGYITQDFVEPAGARALAPAPAPADPAPAPAPADPAPSADDPNGPATPTDPATEGSTAGPPTTGSGSGVTGSGTGTGAAGRDAGSGTGASAPKGAPSDPAETGAPADRAASPTEPTSTTGLATSAPTPALETVSVVTHPISSSSAPHRPASAAPGSGSPLVLIAAAFAVLVMVATASARTLAVRRTRGGPTDSGV